MGAKKLHWDIAPFLKKEERPFNQHEWKCGGGFAQTYCHNDKNCLYKQLKRKEQECDRYREALEEIEGLISDDEFIRCPIDDDVNCNYSTRNKILNIINKVKED